jgi:hypothetical protein
MLLPDSADASIDGRYRIDPHAPLPELGGGRPAFQVSDSKAGDGRLVALAADPFASPRHRCLAVLDRPIDNLMVPVAHGLGPGPNGGRCYYVVCNAPMGRPVSADPTPWPEAALLEQVLRPAVQVLAALQGLGITHRAIRPNNVFAQGWSQPVTLGAAWVAPPALDQPAVFESPFSALCHPVGRGDGGIADDVYALGVLLITLAIGRVPMAELDAAAIARHKLELGSFAALAAGASLPPYLADLLRGMVEDDPDHRSPTRLLMDAATARTRRVAARPRRRSQRPLLLNEASIFDSRMLAYALTLDQRRSVQALRVGAVSHWLRRGLGDGTLAAAVEELVRVRAADGTVGTDGDARLLMQAIVTIEPHMPCCWRGVLFWPNALGALLAEGFRANPRLVAVVEEVLRDDVPAQWEARTSGFAQGDEFPHSFEGRQARIYLQRGGEGATLRLLYAMNPLMPCIGPGMADLWIMTMGSLMAFLETAATRDADAELLTRDMLAFVASRGNRSVAATVTAVLASRDDNARQARLLGLLRDLQNAYAAHPLPGLAAWVAARLRRQLTTYHNRVVRDALIARLGELTAEGFVGRLLALIENPQARADDLAGARQAAELVMAIDREITLLRDGEAARRLAITRVGRETAAAVGMAVLILMLVLSALP